MTGPGQMFGYLNLQVQKSDPYEYMYSFSNLLSVVKPKAPTVGQFGFFSFIVFLVLTFPFSARKDEEIFLVMSKYPPLMTAQTKFYSAQAYQMGVFGKYPNASPFVSFTMNSRLLALILNLTNPPVSFVPYGDQLVFRVKISTEEGNPLFNYSGLTQGKSHETCNRRLDRISKLYIIILNYNERDEKFHISLFQSINQSLFKHYESISSKADVLSAIQEFLTSVKQNTFLKTALKQTITSPPQEILIIITTPTQSLKLKITRKQFANKVSTPIIMIKIRATAINK